MIGALLDMPRAQHRVEDDDPDFGRRLRTVRESYNMTQSEVAERLQMSTDGYRHWEHGRSAGAKKRMPSIAAAFGLSYPELLIRMGLVPPEDMPEASYLDNLTPAHWRRWLSAEYPPDVAMVVTRMLEGASRYDEEELRFIATAVQQALDLVHKRPNRED